MKSKGSLHDPLGKGSGRNLEIILELKKFKDSCRIFNKSTVGSFNYLEPKITMAVMKKGTYCILVKTLWLLKNVTTWENIYLVRAKKKNSFRR